LEFKVTTEKVTTPLRVSLLDKFITSKVSKKNTLLS